MNSIFPPAESADEDGILGFTVKVDCKMLLDAYYHGIFPWPYEERSILWASPKVRGVLPIAQFHIPKSFARELKKNTFEVRIDTCFDDVIDACADIHKQTDQGTWITRKMRKAYKDFHRLGYAHSFESFNKEGVLVGGLYGVLIGRIFCGESMFFRESGASKTAFCRAVQVLKNYGVVLIDTQMVTNLTAAFGAYEITVEEYINQLKLLRDDKPSPDLKLY